MRACPLVGEEVVVDGLPDQAVPELEVVGSWAQYVRVDRLAEACLDVFAPGLGDLDQDLGVQAGAVGRGDPQEPPSVVREAIDTGEKELGQMLGHARGAR